LYVKKKHHNEELADLDACHNNSREVEKVVMI